MAEFFAIPGRTRDVLEKLERQNPENPFCTAGYLQSMEELGGELWIAGWREDNRWLNATGLILRRGRLNYAAQFPSLPPEASQPEYWTALLRFCGERGITQIQGDTFGAQALEVPPLKGETSRKAREEYVIPLTAAGLDQIMARKHLQRYRKARDTGFTIRRRTDPEACQDHIRTIGFSLDRRRGRGETIESHEHERTCLAFLKHKCGELFQAMSGDTVLSSALVLRSARAGYYQSAGTAAEGMTQGATDFLIHNIAQILKDEGAHLLNLGGAAPGSSLAKFKSHFGTSIVSTSAVSLYVGPAWRRKLTTLVGLSQAHPDGLFAALRGETTRLKVYAGETARIPVAAEIPDTRFVRFSADDLKTLKVADAEFRQHQLERLTRLGQSYAYGLYVEGKLAHISWLLPAAALKKEDPWVLQLPDDRAEITGCETLPEYRGRSLYPYVIRKLCGVAQQQGISRIYMKTAIENKSSQTGILKAGLIEVGTALLVASPLLGNRTRVFRLFRG